MDIAQRRWQPVKSGKRDSEKKKTERKKRRKGEIERKSKKPSHNFNIHELLGDHMKVGQYFLDTQTPLTQELRDLNSHMCYGVLQVNESLSPH